MLRPHPPRLALRIKNDPMKTIRNHSSLRLFLVIICLFALTGVPNLAFSAGMVYLSPQEFPKYNSILKTNGHPELKTIFVVYDDSFDPPRAGLKCLDKKGRRFEVYITGDNIVRINKIPGKGKW